MNYSKSLYSLSKIRVYREPANSESLIPGVPAAAVGVFKPPDLKCFEEKFSEFNK